MWALQLNLLLSPERSHFTLWAQCSVLPTWGFQPLPHKDDCNLFAMGSIILMCKENNSVEMHCVLFPMHCVLFPNPLQGFELQARMRVGVWICVSSRHTSFINELRLCAGSGAESVTLHPMQLQRCGTMCPFHLLTFSPFSPKGPSGPAGPSWPCKSVN